MLQEGSLAPDFQLGSFSLSSALGRGPVLLAFFKISCPTCQLTFPFLRRLSDQAGAGAPQLVTISQDDATGTVQFQERFGPEEPALLDLKPYAVSNLYQIRNVPTLYLIEADGRISMAVAGFSKSHMEKLGVAFHEAEHVPAMRPG